MLCPRISSSYSPHPTLFPHLALTRAFPIPPFLILYSLSSICIGINSIFVQQQLPVAIKPAKAMQTWLMCMLIWEGTKEQQEILIIKYNSTIYMSQILLKVSNKAV